MDTRSKILTLDAALQLRPPLVIATGYFSLLLAGHARDLQHARNSNPPAPLLVVVLPGDNAFFDQRARAELVAALRMVDYVVAADYADLDRILGVLQPAAIVRLEAADERRARLLKQHVQRRQTS